jgi:hypothetical protein
MAIRAWNRDNGFARDDAPPSNLQEPLRDRL